jgi:hypothetical protein
MPFFLKTCQISCFPDTLNNNNNLHNKDLFFLPPKAFQQVGNAMISRIKLEFQTKGATDHIPNVPNQGTFEEKMTNSFITPIEKIFLLTLFFRNGE